MLLLSSTLYRQSPYNTTPASATQSADEIGNNSPFYMRSDGRSRVGDGNQYRYNNVQENTQQTQ